MTIDLDSIVAIDVHTHAEIGRGGEDGMRPEWRAAAAKYFGEDGRPIDFTDTRPHFERVMSPALAYVMTDMMKSVITRGTGRAAMALGSPLAGKTGTTNESNDAWFIGYSPDLLAGVWVGHDSKKTLGDKETGGRAALPIWMEFMKRALAGRRSSTVVKPERLAPVVRPLAPQSGPKKVRFARPATFTSGSRLVQALVSASPPPGTALALLSIRGTR